MTTRQWVLVLLMGSSLGASLGFAMLGGAGLYWLWGALSGGCFVLCTAYERLNRTHERLLGYQRRLESNIDQSQRELDALKGWRLLGEAIERAQQRDGSVETDKDVLQ